MNKLTKWLGRTACALLVAGAMLLSGPQYAAAYDCPEPKPTPDTCPPWTTGAGPGSCDQACKDIGWEDGGLCGPSLPDCCTCFM